MSIATAQAQPAGKPTTITGLTGMWFMEQNDFEGQVEPPYKPETRAMVEKREAEENAGKVIDDETQVCEPVGVPGMMLSEFPLEILETPGRITIISEMSPLARTIYLNRTKATEGLPPMYNGYSIGHWEGETLVVETENFNDTGFPFRFGNAVHSATTRLTERISLSEDGKVLVDEMTLHDPRYLTDSYKIVRHYNRLPEDSELWESPCMVGWKDDPTAK
ncbi:hypothetical protein [Novosphingobium pentaromativorans]|uniref:Uncharacterized protein n=1 Tax=Novosphingobium pentaromativorans US6-1 TaxID=1088721 RepID=G6EEQ2_9SPHN|nr:hypothetical protein [Novosphingobium pentaromativorans]AIT79364.1 hypothetical protein JI59_05985 [Novosphingobium pentaromativorans US6-1]EHJ60198.1 hypothetical protein NSU_2823 [Novosphingobium pentaromativorans US6-1]